MVEAEWSTGQVVTPADRGLMEAESAPLFSWILPWGTKSKSTRPQQDGEGQPGIMLDCVLLCFCPEPGKRTPFMPGKGMFSLSPRLAAGGHGQALLLTGLCSDSPRSAVMVSHISPEQLLLPGPFPVTLHALCLRVCCEGRSNGHSAAQVTH